MKSRPAAALLLRRLRFLLATVLALAASVAGALERVPNTTLTLPLEPLAFGYTTENAFGSLTFTDPVAIAAPPGETNRLFVAEQRGRVAVITNLAAPTRSVYLDIAGRVSGGTPTDERGLLGFAFHPGYATNGHLFVFYSTTVTNTLHQRVSRFTADPANPNRALANSELVLISQPDDYGNHNGGDLHFGPDGYLYVSVGDEGDQNDLGNNSQRIDKDFFSGILRIDVDRRPGSLAPNAHPAVAPGTYAVPADNPWIGATNFIGRPVNPAQVRTEFWAVGMRNVWRMSFDPATGALYAGDVGGGQREEINVTTRGGNYGWAYREGTLNGPKSGQAPAGFTSIPPITQYSHGSGALQGRSVTGGVVYRGDRLAQLYGAYVFGDYVSGNLWAVRWTGGATATPMQRLLNRGAIAGFGRDPRNGDVLLADQGTDQIRRLVYNNTPTGTPLPPTLADTGAFADLLTLEAHAGLVPYAPNVPFWSDAAAKRRWFAITATNQLIGFQPEGNWSFPTGMVWVKHFELELTNGAPASARRLETRFLVRNSNGVYGVTYRWTDPPTNAVLVPEEGLDEDFVISDGGILRTQTWHYPSRAECLQCHTPAGGGVLGMDTAQFNGPFDHGQGPTNQLAALAAGGWFANPPANLAALPALAPAHDEAWSVEWRARSWLEANCSMCHQPGGTGLGRWDARTSTPFSLTGLPDGLLNNSEGDPANRLVAPGDFARSMLHTRITRLGPGRMPPLSSSVVDDAGAALLARWITNGLAGWQSYAAWQVTHFGGTNAPAAGPEDDPDADRATNWFEYLTRTGPNDPNDAWTINEIDAWGDDVVLRFTQLANRRFILEWSPDLGAGSDWRPVNAPGNRGFIGAADFSAEIMDWTTDLRRFYRMRVEEP
ncbi:MAG: PQQ-dependent sugar dehydrogenase [Limisphaerales bacterium]